MSPRVRFEPLGEEIDCGAEETVLDAAFRQGYNLVYGCREGQCSACKCFLLEGEAALKRYSNFALSDTELAGGYSLMCRAMPESDLVVELLHYDPDSYRLEHPIRDGVAEVESIEELTHDITRLVLRADGFDFTPGQYVDLHVPGAEDGARRSFSMANLPGEGRIELMIKRYPGGRLSGMLEGQIGPGNRLAYTGPYGSLHAHPGERPILMIAGGSGMAPVLSLLRELAHQGCARPIRFFYGARTERDLFHHAEIGALGERLADFVFSPVTGRFVHEAVEEFLTTEAAYAQPDVYMCGPPPMIEAAEEMLARRGVEETRIFLDKFTTSAGAVAEETTGGAGLAAPVKRVEARAGSQAAENGAGAGSPERDFAWYRPRKRRASLYEDVTVDTQPSIHRHLHRGWPVSFEDGRGTWDDGSTALRAVDWFEFRDPGEQWERPFYQVGTAAEQQIEGAIRSAAEEGLLEDLRPEWVEFLREFLQVTAYAEHGLWFALATVGRDCLSDTVSTCVCLQAAMKQRSAQSIVLYAMDLEERLAVSFPIERARETFLHAPEWQPARRLLERLAATRDWGEVVVAANLCLEPVVGTLLRRELGTRAAAASGDTITPVLARVATQEWEWARRWTVELLGFLLGDSTHGEHNRDRLSDWVRDWLPAAVDAAVALAPLAARIPAGLAAEQALKRVQNYSAAVLSEGGLPELSELVGVSPVQDEPETADAPAAAPRRRRRPVKTAHPMAAVPPEPPVADPESAAYDYVGIVMAKSAEGDAVAELLSGREGTVVYEQPAFWDIRSRHRLAVPYAEVSERLGYEIDAYSIQHEMSTHYGRMVATDDALMLFSDPTEAMQYLMA